MPDTRQDSGVHSPADSKAMPGWIRHNTLIRALLLNTPGMRIIKTGVAVLLCLIFDYLRGAESLTQGAIVALFCLQQNLDSTFKSSLNRISGTVIAGVYAYGFLLLLFQVFRLKPNQILYFLLVVLGTVVLMQIVVLLNRRGGAAIAAMVFLSICVGSNPGSPLQYTLTSVLNAMVGILAALFADWFPPLNRLGAKVWLDKDKLREINAQTGGTEKA